MSFRLIWDSFSQKDWNAVADDSSLLLKLKFNTLMRIWWRRRWWWWSFGFCTLIFYFNYFPTCWCSDMKHDSLKSGSMPSSPSPLPMCAVPLFLSSIHRHHRLHGQRASMSFHFIFVRQKPITCTFIWLVSIQFTQMYVMIFIQYICACVRMLCWLIANICPKTS